MYNVDAENNDKAASIPGHFIDDGTPLLSTLNLYSCAASTELMCSILSQEIPQGTRDSNELRFRIETSRYCVASSCADFVEATGFHRDRHLSMMNTWPGKLKLYGEEECLDCTSKVIARTSWNFYANYERLNFSFRNDYIEQNWATTRNKIISEF